MGKAGAAVPEVLIATTSFGAEDDRPLRLLEERGFRYRVNPHGRRLTAAEVKALLGDADGMIAGTEPLNAEVLQAAGRLKVISRCGVGVDNVDLATAEALGIAVLTTTGAATNAVAELVLAGILALLRHLPSLDRRCKAREWKREMGRLLEDRCVGIVGLGRIGKRVAELVSAFRAQVVAHDLLEDREFARVHRIEYLPLDSLLRRADIVTLHVNLGPATKGLIRAEQLALMRPGALLVNCARGDLVDEVALADAIRTGHLGGAFLDTFGEEPYVGPLLDLPQVLVTPHIGAYTVESRVAMEMEAARNLIQFFERGGAA
ncbi:MAG: phosphoglycerate dehydrogenase, D-3-phosphoglycerate dehydrogenase [candidate division NC10 bacterium CSP1-5]|nr:MAG: phosphoglycerate dehydrogenase, D-3-phosphoglycerate dehydrogenase [candidate division NC10 bacterium CSP1-5]